MVTKYVTLDEKRKGLSKKESYLLSYLVENRKSIFALEDVVEVLDCSYKNAKVIVERLAKKKWIVRIIKGKYLIVPLAAGVKGEYTEHEFIIASLFYIGYTKGADVAGDNALFWILANGIPSALGTLLAFGHPFTIISAFLAAPITSLTPNSFGSRQKLLHHYARP